MSSSRSEPAPPEIVGSPKFAAQIRKALALLERRSPKVYETVCAYVRRIEQGSRSGMWAYRTPPTLELADVTSFYSRTWCAGSIVHDAIHSRLYHEHRATHGGRVPHDVWTGPDAERECLRHQLAALKAIRAPGHEIAHCKKQRGDHHDINGDGKFDWEDHKLRDW